MPDVRAKQRTGCNAMRTKSRVNIEDPPANFEEVKRRFIRQNRELAKHNSGQSLRIRSLEVEVNRLLAENLDLRQQILELQNDVQSARRHGSNNTMRRIRHDLEAKISELSKFVDGLQEEGASQEDWKRVEDQDRVLSPSRRQYRERQPLAELLQDAVMPTIAEDKSYPRRTLNTDEIRTIRLSDQSAGSGSPDLGPPPVAHFEFGSSQESETQRSTRASPTAADEDLLPSINLETRKKRRDGGSKDDARRPSILPQVQTSEDEEVRNTMLRTGAKRKLADRELEKSNLPFTQDEFTFSRKVFADQSLSDNSNNEGKSTLQLENKADQKNVRPARKVLGEKNVNASPKKNELQIGKPVKSDAKKADPPKFTASSGRAPTRGRRVSAIPTPAHQEELLKVTEIELPKEVQPGLGDDKDRSNIAEYQDSDPEQVEGCLNPNTPATENIFSPMTAPSIKAEGRDTPPPANLTSSSNTTEGGQRPSRRARSAVNYAEPSLVAKMRRPGKEMVDAISGIQDSRRAPNSSTENGTPGDVKLESAHLPRTIVIKREPLSGGSDWNSVPRTANRRETASPLRERSTDEHPCVPSLAANMSAEIEEPRASTSTASLSSVIATSRKRREQLDRRSSSQPLGASRSVAKKMEELDLYDFKDSSSPGGDSSSSVSAGADSSHRRHSSVPKDPDTATVTAAALAGRAERATRRRSMML